MRRLKIKGALQFSTIRQKTERRDLVRLDKAEQRALVDTNIEKELLDRLKLGTYGELYEDLVNLNKKVFDQMLENEEAVPESEDVSFNSAELEQIDIENDLEFVAGKDGFDEEDFEDEDGEEEGLGDDDDEQPETNGGKEGKGKSGDPKRQKKLAKAVLGKKMRDKKINLAFESAEMETEKQLN